MTNLIALPTGTELVGDYRIQRVLGAGGFGVTYLADELALSRVVTIKEYFPSDFAARAGGIEAAPRSSDCAGDFKWGLDRFIEEAQTLARFDHPNIVRVYRYFRANSTGYMVLQFEEGQSLKSWLKGLSRAPRQKEIDGIVAPLLDALELIHKADFLHRDIAPDNIIVRKDGVPVLIDFGSARGEIAAHSRTVSALVKPGYSPYEQYAETSRQQGPWSDIYALAATLYHAITGKRPPDSPSRMLKDEYVPARDAAVGAYRANFLKAIDRALILSVDARPQSVAIWRAELLAPDAPKASWLSRGRGSNDKAIDDALAAVTPPVTPVVEPVLVVPPVPAAVPVPVTPAVVAGALASTPAAAKKGGFFDFLSGFKSGGATAGDTMVLEPPTLVLPPEPAPVKPAKTPPKPRAKAKSKSQRAAAEAKPEPVVAPPAPVTPLTVPPAPTVKKSAPERVTPARHRPVPIGGGSKGSGLWWKVLIAAGIAGALVALQDRLPKLADAATTASVTAQDAPLLVREIKAHSGDVNGLAFADEGRSLVSAGRDGTLKVWSAFSGSLLRSGALQNRLVTSLAVMGRRAVAGHAEGHIALYDLDSASRIVQIKRNDADVWSVAFLDTPERFIAASHDWVVSVYDAKSATAAQFTLDGHENAVQAVAYSSSGPWIASGGADKTVRLYDVATHDLVRSYKGLKDFVTALAFSPDGKTLAVASLDGAIRLYSTQSTRLKSQLTGHKGRVGSLAFAPNGEVLASAADEGIVRLWDVKRGRSLRSLSGHTGGAKAVAFAPDGAKLATSGADGMVRLWTVPAIKDRD
jgi:WD40 repeat protein/serine/threonine protein kinase